MSICVVVPTRGRPQAAVALAEAFLATRWYRSTRLVFAIDDDDPKLPDYSMALPEDDYVVGPRLRMGPTLNAVASLVASTYDIVGFMGDDHRPRSGGWDSRVEEALTDQPGVAYGNDLVHGPNLPTAAFVSSAIICRLGYMQPPGLIHLYIDNYWLELGRATHLAYLPDVTIEHLHPIAAKAEWDEGYIEVNSGEMQAHDHGEFQRYMAQDWPTERAKLVGLGSAAV